MLGLDVLGLRVIGVGLLTTGVLGVGLFNVVMLGAAWACWAYAPSPYSRPAQRPQQVLVVDVPNMGVFCVIVLVLAWRDRVWHMYAMCLA
jgi:hypothetical protein